MLSCPRVCRERGCGQPNQRGSGFCEKHVTSNSYVEEEKFRYKHDAVSQMYSRAPWPTFRKWILARNPICQRLHARVQCHNPATLVHHLVSPRTRPDLFVTAANCVALCVHCHPTDEGTPNWRPGVEYVPTEI